MRKLKNEELIRKSRLEFKEANKSPLIFVLDNVRSLHNVGSVFRTADAFLVQAVLLCGVTGTPPDKEIHKTALGATETVDWRYFENTMDAVSFLKEQGWEVWAVEQVEQSKMLHRFAPLPGKKYALVLGNEVFGVEQEVVDACDGTIEIPQLGSKHSLNIAVSAGIVCWHFMQNQPSLAEIL